MYIYMVMLVPHWLEVDSQWTPKYDYNIIKNIKIKINE